MLDFRRTFDSDTDYASFPERFEKGAAKIAETASAHIRDPKARQAWLAEFNNRVLSARDDVIGLGLKGEREARLVNAKEGLKGYQAIIADPDAPEDARAHAQANASAAIEMMRETGDLSPADADEWLSNVVEGGNFVRGEREVERDPSVISGKLPASVSERSSVAMNYYRALGYTKEQAAGIVGNLLAESSLDTVARNGGDGRDGSDSIGIGQWNSDRARALKKFAADNDSDWHDFETQLAFVHHELQTSEKAAGDKLRSAKDITSATEAMIGYERPAGSQNGPRGAHNYKGRLRYAQQAAGETVKPEWLTSLPPEKQFQIEQRADTRQRQLDTERKVDAQFVIERAANDAPAAIQNTGEYTGPVPTEDQFKIAYGDEAASKYAEFQAGMQTSRAIFDMKSLSADDIKAVVEAAKPSATGTGAAIEQQRYETLSKAADTIIKERDADPASYARKAFPAVDAAWQNANADGYQNAIAASVAAQRQLGVTNVKPLPKPAAESVVANYKNVNNSEEQRIAAISSALMATPDAAQRRVIFEQLVDAGLPDITEGAVEALARGDGGAANRLFQAAMVDIDKLPGKAPEKPTAIKEAIQDGLMAEGEVGDIYYGLSDGVAENFVRAERDGKLLTNAVTIRLRNGEDLGTAVQAAAKDLFGDVQVVDGGGRVNAQILLPASEDADAVIDGLAALEPELRKAVSVTVPDGIPAKDGSKAIVEAATSAYADNVLAEGFWRNSGDGFVFIDPYIGKAIAGPDGSPIIFKPVQPKPGAPAKSPFSPRAVDENASRQKAFQ